ncbi:hypothetical protein AVEN_9093-1 [Araneus ventricosus]|uniref:Uncharacterized protein n=1 Tax=Araneus ventricosus TaxID=182803 RepID=A0A4Y2JKX7_ARAVE|nr:hypothetical protein AVEN_9093-1 [Araneus ventricosus]
MHTYLFEYDSSPQYFTITIINNEKPSDSHCILGRTFYQRRRKGNDKCLKSIRESLGEATPAGSLNRRSKNRKKKEEHYTKVDWATTPAAQRGLSVP